jgi:hypothetical protein
MANITVNPTMTWSGDGIAVPASGAYAMLPCSHAGQPTPKRHADVAFERNQGTSVWSPPT